jgi:beta-lactamase regulating signal transducer with metallopeptidase domain
LEYSILSQSIKGVKKERKKRRKNITKKKNTKRPPLVICDSFKIVIVISALSGSARASLRGSHLGSVKSRES